MAFQTFENDENNRGQIKRKNLKIEIRSTWLGWRDSNPRMHGPKPCALPLGDTPLLQQQIASAVYHERRYYCYPPLLSICYSYKRGGCMVKKYMHERPVQKSGNFLRTLLIWLGILIGIATFVVEYVWPGNEKVVLYLFAMLAVVYGVVLLDFDVDDDD